jgi:hypothetical protein
MNETKIKNAVQTIQNTVNTSTHISKTPTHYKTHTYTHPHITKQVNKPQYKIHPNEIVYFVSVI